MKKIICALLVCASASVFAQVGDAPIVNNVNSNVTQTLNQGFAVQDLFKDGKAGTQLKYISLSNKQNNLLNDNLSNLNKYYSIRTLYDTVDNEPRDITIKQSMFLDKDNIIHQNMVLQNTPWFGFNINTPDTLDINYNKLVKAFRNKFPTMLFTRISIERQSNNSDFMVGFVGAQNQTDIDNNKCSENEFTLTGKYIGSHSGGCFDL